MAVCAVCPGACRSIEDEKSWRQLIVDIALLHIGKQKRQGSRIRAGIRDRQGVAQGYCVRAIQATWRQTAIGALEVHRSQGDLLQVVLAGHACRGFADFLNGGQQEPDQNCDDRDDDQQLDEGKPSTTNTTHHDKSLPKKKDRDQKTN